MAITPSCPEAELGVHFRSLPPCKPAWWEGGAARPEHGPGMLSPAWSPLQHPGSRPPGLPASARSPRGRSRYHAVEITVRCFAA